MKSSASMAEMTTAIVVPNPVSVTGQWHLYKKRWLLLALFVFYSMSNAMQWIQYSIIANVVMNYYNVSPFAVDCTSIVYMVTYIPLIFPASWILDRYGIKIAVITGAIGTSLGSWIKVLSVSPNRFAIAFLGQSIVAISQTFILSLPSRLSAVWFGQNEVSLACSIGVFGNQLGIAIGFVLPTMLVKYSEDISVTEDGLRILHYSVAIFTTFILAMILIFFQDKPKLPPSPAQAQNLISQVDNNGGDFWLTLRKLFGNFGFILLLLSYGINVGVFYAISTLLNEVVLIYFPNSEADAGRIGLVIVVIGMLGSVLCGFVLDKTRLFKETTLCIYALSVLGMIAYTFTLGCGHIIVVYFTAAFLGFFMTGYLPVGFELAAELTYPEPEGTATGMINAGAQVFGIVFTILYRWLIGASGDVSANICLIFMLICGTVLTLFIPSDLRRQLASLGN